MSEVDFDRVPDGGASPPSPTPPPVQGEGLVTERRVKAALPHSGGGVGEGEKVAQAASEPADWREAVAHPDLRKQLDRYESIEDLMRHNLALRRRLSRAVTPPGADAAPDELAEFRSRLGVPESPGGYEYEPPGDLPEILAEAADEGELAEIFEVAHGLGLTQAQLSGLLDWRFEQLAGAGTRLEGQLARAREDSERALRREWGREYERNLNLSRRALRDFGGDGLVEFLTRARVDGAQLANHPEIVRWAAGVGRALGEASLHLGGGAGGQSPEERRAALTHAIHDARAAGDSARARELDSERRALTGRIYGGE